MEMVRVGIIGIGNIGFAHASCIYQKKINGLTLAVVCDSNPERLTVANEELPGVDTCADYEELLNRPDIDMVIVSVPHPLHSVVAMRAFACGKHVLIEKPADIAVSRVHQMNAAAKNSGKLFGIMFNQRTGELFQKAREIVKSGALGQLKRSVWIVTNWYRTQHYYDSGSWRATWQGEGGGVLMNQAPHQLDLWQWICGMPERVTAFCDEARYHNIEVEDDATIYARFPGGADGVFITSTGEFPGTNRLEISGTKGKLLLENGTLKWWKLEQDEREVCVQSQKSFEQIPMNCEEFLPTKENTGHAAILQNFADALRYGKELIAPGYDGINEVTLQNAAYLSAWKGSIPVQLPFDEAEYDRLLAEKQKKSKQADGKGSSAVNTAYHERWQINW